MQRAVKPSSQGGGRRRHRGQPWTRRAAVRAHPPRRVYGLSRGMVLILAVALFLVSIALTLTVGATLGERVLALEEAVYN